VKHIIDTKRVQVSFTEKQWRIIENLRGVLGDSDADIVRNMVISWLAEKSLITSYAKKGDALIEKI
jgi:hypothetical protein